MSERKTLMAAAIAAALHLPAPAGAAATPAAAPHTPTHDATGAAPPRPAGRRPMTEVIVTADPLASTAGHIVQPVDVLDADELLARDVRSIGETVGRELGVNAADFGPAVGRPVIRGQTGARVRVLDDGLGTMDVSTISADHAIAAEPVFADQVEIYRGPATLLFGSGASGGLVNIVNNRILDYVPEGIEGDAYGHYDTVSDGWLGAGRVNAGAGNVAVHFDAMRRDTDDYDIPGFGERVPDAPDERSGTLENSDAESESYAGGASWVGERGFLGFAVSGLDNEYGVPGGGHAHEGEEQGDEHGHGGGVRIAQEQTRFDLKGALADPLPGIHKVRTRWGHNDHEHRELGPSGEVGTLLVNEEWEGRVEAQHEPLAGWDGVVGVQYHDRQFESTGEEAFVPDSSLESVGVFVLEKRDIGAWHYELGARYEHQSADNGVLGADVSHDAWSMSGGASRAFTEGYEIGVAVTRAQRAPSLEELFANGPHLATNTFEVGDATLGEETSNNIDLSLSRVDGPWTWTINLFYNRIDDYVNLRENDRNADGVADRVAEDFGGDPADILPADELEEPLLVSFEQIDAEFHGVEFETGLTLFDDARGRLDARAWTDFVRARVVDGDDLPRIPPLRFGGSLGWSRGPWVAGIDITRNDDQDAVAALESATDGYNVLEVNASYNRAWNGARWTLFARGSNLLDEEARRHTSFLKDSAPLPGRSGIVGVRARF